MNEQLDRIEEEGQTARTDEPTGASENTGSNLGGQGRSSAVVSLTFLSASAPTVRRATAGTGLAAVEPGYRPSAGLRRQCAPASTEVLVPKLASIRRMVAS